VRLIFAGRLIIELITGCLCDGVIERKEIIYRFMDFSGEIMPIGRQLNVSNWEFLSSLARVGCSVEC
jgi:hypothetical protein